MKQSARMAADQVRPKHLQQSHCATGLAGSDRSVYASGPSIRTGIRTVLITDCAVNGGC